jgi:hypothetical protein
MPERDCSVTSACFRSPSGVRMTTGTVCPTCRVSRVSRRSVALEIGLSATETNWSPTKPCLCNIHCCPASRVPTSVNTRVCSKKPPRKGLLNQAYAENSDTMNTMTARI